ATETPAPAAEKPAAEQPAAAPTPGPVASKAEPEEEVREHIEMKAPKLEGPKIIGKIELPLNNSAGKQDRKDKRKRKRIPLENKKPESNRPGTGQGQTGANTGTGQRNNRPGQGGQGNNQ